MIGRDLESAEREIVVTFGEVVFVEHDLGGGRALAAWTAAVDCILRALACARGVLPRAVGDGCRFVGLLDAGLDLVEDAITQGHERREHRVGVGVLGFEVSNDLGIVAVTQPVPVVAPIIAMCRQYVGDSARAGRRHANGGRFGSGHRRASLNGAGRRFATATISTSCHR